MSDSEAHDRRALFDTWARDYDDAVRDRRDFPFLGYEDVLHAIVSRTAPAAGRSVLDLGIGTGNLAEPFVAAGCEVWGVDFSPAMLERAGDRLPTVHRRQADLMADDLEDALDLAPGHRFDAIVSAYVLHEFPLEATVGLLRRLADGLLVPGGAIVVGDIAFPTAALRTAAAAQWADRWDASEHYWAADAALPALRAAGLAAEYEQVSSCAGVFTLRLA